MRAIMPGMPPALLVVLRVNTCGNHCTVFIAAFTGLCKRHIVQRAETDQRTLFIAGAYIVETPEFSAVRFDEKIKPVAVL